MEKRKCFDIEMGEPSTTRKHHFDSNCENKPLKKARYVWELKGKYHLKANCDAIRKSQAFHVSREPVCDTSSDSDSDSENHSLKDGDSDQELFNIDKSISDEIPITLVKANQRSQDEYLEKWRARQIAKGFVDNTINTILELWKNAPFDSSELVENASELIENCENDEQVEDEGIMMAIQSHGLHSGMQAPLNGNSSDINDVKPCTSGIQNFEKKTFIKHPSSANCENVEDPMDFLSNAVSVAIQKIGLASCNYR